MSKWQEYLDSLWRKDGRVYKCVAVISDPAVEIENVECPTDRHTLVIGSRMYEEYERLVPARGPLDAIDHAAIEEFLNDRP